MKILYVITGLGQGGAERVVCDLADQMFQRGYKVKIAYLVGDIITKPKHKEIELINIGLSNIMSLPKAYFKLAKIIKGYQPDVVHAHMVHANLLSRLVRVVTPMSKLITTAHNSNEGDIARMLAYRVTHHLANLTTNVSKEATTAFVQKRAVPRGGMQTVYNGIDLNRFNYVQDARVELNAELNLDKNCKVLLAVGRFNEQKDYPNLLKAVHLLKKEFRQPFKLLIVGDGNLRADIERIIDDLSIKSEVILLGRRSDISRLMSAADLFVLSSKFEGFGLVVAEAMACQCLVVATDCGGVSEVLDNANFLVLAGNPILLKDKIKYALNIDDYNKNKIIERNLQHVQKNFSLESIMKQWIVLYNEK